MGFPRRSRVPTPRRPAAAHYDGFLSYSHAADEELAAILQAGLHEYGRPWYLRRRVRVFRDQASMGAEADL